MSFTMHDSHAALWQIYIMLNLLSLCVSNPRSFQMVPWVGATPKAHLASVHIFQVLVKAVISASWAEVPTGNGFVSVTLSAAVTACPALQFPCLTKLLPTTNPGILSVVQRFLLQLWPAGTDSLRAVAHCWLGGSPLLVLWAFSRLLPSPWSAVLSVEKLDSHLNQEIQQTRIHCTPSSFVTGASTYCSEVPPWDGGAQISGSQADRFSKIIGLLSQPWVTLSRWTEFYLFVCLFVCLFFLLPILGFSYAKANNFRLSLAKPGRKKKSVLQIQVGKPRLLIPYLFF